MNTDNGAHSVLRLMRHQPRPGVENMAIDEAVLMAVNDNASPPTLRFYRWSEPTISLGYFQKFESTAEQAPAVAKLPVVRRQTGGGAILHDDELTYSLMLPLDGRLPTDIEDVYRLMHDAYIAALAQQGVTATYRGGEDRGNAQRGPFFCFARGHRLDLVIGPDKVLGSAQRRVKNAVLQHGSLILGRRFLQQPAAEARTAAPNSFDLDQFITTAATQIAQGLALSPQNADLTTAETAQSQQLKEKYQGPDWNQQR